TGVRRVCSICWIALSTWLCCWKLKFLLANANPFPAPDAIPAWELDALGVVCASANPPRSVMFPPGSHNPLFSVACGIGGRHVGNAGSVKSLTDLIASGWATSEKTVPVLWPPPENAVALAFGFAPLDAVDCPASSTSPALGSAIEIAQDAARGSAGDAATPASGCGNASKIRSAKVTI